MPKSKRDKKVSLTKTAKKGLELKQNLIEEVSACSSHPTPPPPMCLGSRVGIGLLAVSEFPHLPQYP
ncbi:rCG31507, isoform CRA_d [Rattus norvegicus]|uniref:RCG31507, isoform CRA_d n=1 Tax=Rattus norvegicus TaxID=10116 RepID=A6ITM0_RAT|nr:rCG31507, isoform CRA_d [Rattus norvegicus]